MEKLKAGMASSRHYRNRRIGEFLKEIDLAEKKATGITKILNALKHNGSPPPDFETDEERNYFTVTIRRHSIFESLDTLNENADGLVNDLESDLVNDPVNDLDDLVIDPDDLENQTQIRILSMLRANNRATYDQLANQVGVSASTIKRNLKKLSEMQLIKRMGSDKAGYWEILKR
jgi:ATP-dependent DNA helicase RecG